MSSTTLSSSEIANIIFKEEIFFELHLIPSMSDFAIDLVALRDITTSMASKTSGSGRGREAKRTQRFIRQLLKRGAKGAKVKSLHV
jgi:hypothetical protein